MSTEKRTWSDDHTANVIAGQVKEIDRLQAVIAEQRDELARRRKQATEDAEWLTTLREQLVVVAHVLCSALLKFHRIPARTGKS